MQVNDFAESLRLISPVVFLFQVIENCKWWVIVDLRGWVLEKRPMLWHATFKYLEQKHHKSYEPQTFCIITQQADLHMHVTRAKHLIFFHLRPWIYQSVQPAQNEDILFHITYMWIILWRIFSLSARREETTKVTYNFTAHVDSFSSERLEKLRSFPLRSTGMIWTH